MRREDFLDEFTDLGEWPRVDTNGNEMPDYVWTCNPVQYVALSIDSIADILSNDVPEDFEFGACEGLQELQSAIDAFNEANEKFVWYEPDFSKSLIIKP